MITFLSARWYTLHEPQGLNYNFIILYCVILYFQNTTFGYFYLFYTNLICTLMSLLFSEKVLGNLLLDYFYLVTIATIDFVSKTMIYYDNNKIWCLVIK